MCDAVAFLVGGGVVGDGTGARRGRGDDGLDPAFGQQVAQVVCIVGFVGKQLPDRTGTLDQLRGDRDVVGIAGGQDEDARPVFPSVEGMEYGP